MAAADPSAPHRLGVRAAVAGGELVPGDVLVADGRGRAIGGGPAGASGVAVPGFLDLHVNGYAGVDFLAADVEGYRAARAALAATGTTGIVPTFITSPLDDYAPALAAAAHAMEDDGAGARILGVHLEGPF